MMMICNSLDVESTEVLDSSGQTNYRQALKEETHHYGSGQKQSRIIVIIHLLIIYAWLVEALCYKLKG
jgi:hypothetical protein